MELSRRQRLRPCPHCARHIKVAESRCRYCGAALTARGLTTAPLLLPVALGLLVAGCNKNDPPTTPPDESGPVGSDSGDSTTPPPIDDDTVAEPMYGVPMTDDDLTEPGDDQAGSSPPPEPAYGVPMKDDDVADAEYGMPDLEPPMPGPEPAYGVAEPPPPRKVRRQQRRARRGR